MTNLRRTAALLAASLLASASVPADLSLESAHPLTLTFHGRPLVIEQQLFPEMAGEPDLREVQVAGWQQAHHLWWADKTSRIREEIAVRADAFELTHVRLIQPKVHGFTSVALIIPHELLDGVQVEALGSPTPAEHATQQGRAFTCKLGPEGVTRIKELLYLRVHLPGGALDFDLNVRGRWIGGDGITKRTAVWQLFRDKDGYHLHTGDNKSQWGGLHEFKLVIRPALDIPIEQVHPVASTRWTQPFPVALRVNFGEVAVEGYTTCSLALPFAKPPGDGPGDNSAAAEATAGWADPSLLKLETNDRFAETAPVRVEGVSPRDAATQPPSALKLRLERDGYYLVSLLVGSTDRVVGPCEVYGGVGEPRKAPQVAAGEYGSWPIVGHAVDGVLEVTLRGGFRLVAASAAAMMYENEDYLFGRGWWLSTEFHEGDHLPR